jgi:tetratricopeptide (TPR) repeat protein
MYNVMLHENHQNTFQYDLKLFDHLMDYFEKNEIKDNPTLEIFYYIAILEKTRDEKYFHKLIDLKKKYRELITPFDNYMLYLHLDTYCATEFNENCRTDLLNEQFLLVKENLMFELVGDGKILYPDFLNEVKKAVRVNEFEWAEEYINKYKNNLTEEFDNTLNFCYGYIAHKKGEFEKALDYFSRTSFPNFIIKIQVKIHLLQLYIELKYFDQAQLMIDSFRHYLTREKSIIDSMKVSVFEFLKISGDLIKLKSEIKTKENDFKLNKIKQEIENMSNNRFGIKLWLREKAIDS